MIKGAGVGVGGDIGGNGGKKVGIADTILPSGSVITLTVGSSYTPGI